MFRDLHAAFGNTIFHVKFFNNSSKLTLEMGKNSLFEVNLLITFLPRGTFFLNCTDDFLKTTQRVCKVLRKGLF